MSDQGTILAVDDTSESLALLVETLTAAGYEVRPADSGELALAAIAANPPDLILLDVRMKGVDGIEVCRRLKAREETRHIPIILISAFADAKEWVEGLQLGAADYITKPFQREELLTRVKTHLTLHRMDRSLLQQAALLSQANEQLRSEIVQRQRVQDEQQQTIVRSERSRLAMLSTLEDQKRVAAELRIAYAQQKLLSNVLQVSLEDTSLELKLAKVLDVLLAMPELTLESKGAIFLMEGDTLAMKVQRNLSEAILVACAHVPCGKCLCGRVATSGHIEFCDSLDERHEIRYDGIQPHGHYCVPIRSGDKVTGVIALYMAHGCKRDEKVEQFLTAVANTLSMVVERKQAEEALKESKALTEVIVENIPLMIFLKEVTDLRFVIFNRAGEELLGYDRKALLGKNNLDLFPPEEAAHFMAKDREVLDGETGVLDIQEESILTAKKGKRLLHTRKVCIRGSDGKTKYLLGVSEDITEHKRAEAEHAKLLEQFMQAQKMESVGRLAGGVAHDFNNLLMGIMGYAELCKNAVGENSQVREWLDEIMRETQRSANLTRQLLAFARRQTVAPQVIDLNDAVGNMLKMLRRLIGEDIDLAWLPGAEPWSVKIDPGQVDQILANLCVNARDAIGRAGKITIETDNVSIDADYCADHAEAVPGSYVMLAVSDNGCGMDQETLGKIFEPFFTTKPTGEGTGLGLATVYGIAKQNNGFINVYSEPGKGTTFRIYLPRDTSDVKKVTDAGTKTVVQGGAETILLVEDEAAIRFTIRLFLERFGYTVIAAECPEEALRLAAEHRDGIDLLLTDVVMPGMSGRELAGKLAVDYPSMKILYMSGYTADVIANRGILEDGVQFISKPVGRDALVQKVREVLGTVA